MTDPTSVHAQIRARITATVPLSPGALFDGLVPDKVPQDRNGFILPYVAIFSGIGAEHPDARDLSNMPDLTWRNYGFVTTVVAASQGLVIQVADALTTSLTGFPVSAGWIKPNALQTPDNVLYDTGITPARHYLPLAWQLTTT